MKFKLFVLAFIYNLTFAQSEKPDYDKIENIKKVITLFKEKDIEKISKIINYPLNRESPIPLIKNQSELKGRFHEIFDESLIHLISSSNVNQWTEVGWRGVMLNDGIIWIDENGKIIAVNYQSSFEKKQKQNLINKQKTSLYPGLKNFLIPTYKFRTKNYLIRIDELENRKYRYASWKINTSESLKPDLVLKNGNLEFDGSGGNHTIIFKNKNYEYKIYRSIVGSEDEAEISLIIEKDGKVMLSEIGKLME